MAKVKEDWRRLLVLRDQYLEYGGKSKTQVKGSVR